MALLPVLLLAACATGPTPQARSGEVDLSSWDPVRDGPVKLKGEWDFYPSRFLPPDAFPETSDEPPPEGGVGAPVPGILSDITVDGRGLANQGWGTFHLRVQLPPGVPDLGLYLPDQGTAWQLWADGDLVATVGQPGADPSSTVPRYQVLTRPIRPRGESLDLVLHLSNFHHRSGGLWNPMELGLASEVSDRLDLRAGLELFVCGALVTMGLYHLILFAYRPKDPSALTFGLLCLTMALRVLFTGQRTGSRILPGLPWSWDVRVEHLTVYLLGPAFLWFLHGVLGGFRRVWGWVYTGISAAFTALVLLMPPLVFTFVIQVFQGLTLPVFLALLWLGGRAAVQGREGSRLLLLGVAIVMAAFVNDTLHANDVIHTGYTAAAGMMVFCLVQAAMLSMRSMRAYAAIERMSEELQLTNRAMNRFVPSNFLRILHRGSITEVGLGDNVGIPLTVLFSDIRSFTALSERMGPDDTFKFVNGYLNRMAPVISRHQGFIDKYIGDAIMALFDASPDHAVEAAIGMIRELETYNEGRARAGYAPVAIGVGIHHGPVMLGTVGEPHRMDSTVIGDAVNLASRVEGLTKQYGTPILITEAVRERLQGIYTLRPVDRVTVRGKSRPVDVYEVLEGLPQERRDRVLATLDAFREGMGLWLAGDREGARARFRECPEDPVARMYLER